MKETKQRKKRRQHNKDGWTKGECPYCPTGWAWYKNGDCTCSPCKPLRDKLF